jgi:hypothetical protein
MSSLKKDMLSQEITRKQFLQLIVGSSLLLFGFGNLMSFFKHITGMRNPAGTTPLANHGFGSSKFGV